MKQHGGYDRLQYPKRLQLMTVKRRPEAARRAPSRQEILGLPFFTCIPGQKAPRLDTQGLVRRPVSMWTSTSQPL